MVLVGPVILFEAPARRSLARAEARAARPARPMIQVQFPRAGDEGPVRLRAALQFLPSSLQLDREVWELRQAFGAEVSLEFLKAHRFDFSRGDEFDGHRLL